MNLGLPLMFGLLAVLSMVWAQSIHAELEYDFEIGSSGIDADELNNPTDVAVSKDGNSIYVVDSANSRINVFDDDGEHDFDFGSFCSIFTIQSCHDNAAGADNNGDGQFDNPTRATIAINGDLFVTDSYNSRIQKFDDDGRFEIKFGSANPNAVDYLGLPNGIAVLDSTGDIYVSDAVTDSVRVFDASGAFLFDFDSFDGDEFQNPSSILIDSADKLLYVSDSGNDQIVIFKIASPCPAGNEEIVDGICFVEKFGTSGSGNGEFDSPTGLALDTVNDLLYVADTDNDRIQVFRLASPCPAGNEEIVDGICFVEKFGTSGSGNGEFDSPTGLALDTVNDLLYVADTDNDRVQALSFSVASLVFIPSPPDNLDAVPISPTSILVTWDEPSLKKDIAKITGYKIEYRTGTDDYKTVVADTKSTLTYFVHEGLDSGTTYYYRVSSINSEGIAPSSTNYGVQPQHTTEPSGLIAHDISPNQIRLKWYPPTNTFGQPISGYEIKRVLSPGVYDPVGETDSKTTTFVVNNLQSDKTHSFVVAAKVGFGYSNESHSASATPHAGSIDKFSNAPAVNVISTPSAPLGLVASPVSSSQINLSWNAPSSNGNSAITGYRIETKQDSGSFVTLVEDTKSVARTYQHTNLSPDSKYTYKVYAINSAGIGSASNEADATATYNTFKIQPIGKFAIDEGKTLTFIVKVSGSTAGISYALDGNVPEGAQINANTGMFSWTTNHSQGTKSYTFDIVATKDAISDRQPITITVNDVANTIPNIPAEPQDEPDAESETIAPFVDITRDPQYYVDRYNNEPTYKTWFDENYPQYESIYDAVGLVAPLKTIAPFVDAAQDPRYYILRYEYEPTYKTWFDENYPKYESIYDAVGLVVGQEFDNEYGYCGEGTKSIDGVCTIVDVPQSKPWWQFW